MIIQFGLSLVIPVLACVYGAWWLTEHTGVGGWVFIPALILGLGSSCMTWYKLYLANEKKRQGKDAGNTGSGARQGTDGSKGKQGKSSRKDRKAGSGSKSSFNTHL